MMTLLSEENERKEFFNLSPEERLYFDLEAKEKQEKDEIIEKLFEAFGKKNRNDE